jgi:hypothetical protein
MANDLASLRDRYPEQECKQTGSRAALPVMVLIIESGLPGRRAAAIASLSLFTAA